MNQDPITGALIDLALRAINALSPHVEVVVGAVVFFTLSWLKSHATAPKIEKHLLPAAINTEMWAAVEERAGRKPTPKEKRERAYQVAGLPMGVTVGNLPGTRRRALERIMPEVRRQSQPPVSENTPTKPGRKKT